MKKIILLILVAFCSLTIQAQDWSTDLEDAKTVAAASDKEILLVFAGSDWCGPCIKLEKEIWESSTFQDYAKDHYVMVKADFPRKKANRLSKEQQAQNGALAEKYNPQGFFPLVLRLDATGKVIGKTGYKSLEPTAYIDLLESL